MMMIPIVGLPALVGVMRTCQCLPRISRQFWCVPTSLDDLPDTVRGFSFVVVPSLPSRTPVIATRQVFMRLYYRSSPLVCSYLCNQVLAIVEVLFP